MKTYANVINVAAVRGAVGKPQYEALRALAQIEAELTARFVQVEEPVRALILAILTGEPLLFIGPPGTAKSRLIRAFCEYIGIPVLSQPDQPHPDYFEYLLTPFTEPGELFGFYDMGAVIDRKQLRRDQSGMIQQAKVVYIDEVFNGSSAILNSMLALMNERIYHERGQRQRVNMQVMFGATNQLPQTDELRALFDRFLIRCEVKNIGAGDGGPKVDQVRQLVQTGWRETYTRRAVEYYPDLLERLAALREGLAEASRGQEMIMQNGDPDFYRQLAQLVSHVRRWRLSEMSSRRLVKFMNLMLYHALYRMARDGQRFEQLAISEADLALWRFLLDRRNEAAEVHLPAEVEA